MEEEEATTGKEEAMEGPRAEVTPITGVATIGTTTTRRPHRRRSSLLPFDIGDDTNDKHYATYATVLEAITTHVQKNYKGGADMAKSLKDGKMMDLSTARPVRLRSEAKEEADRVFEQAGFDIAFTEEHNVVGATGRLLV